MAKRKNPNSVPLKTESKSKSKLPDGCSFSLVSLPFSVRDALAVARKISVENNRHVIVPTTDDDLIILGSSQEAHTRTCHRPARLR